MAHLTANAVLVPGPDVREPGGVFLAAWLLRGCMARLMVLSRRGGVPAVRRFWWMPLGQELRCGLRFGLPVRARSLASWFGAGLVSGLGKGW